MPWAGAPIFAIVYLLVSARRLHLVGLDRPAAVLAGAVACVAAGVLSPRAALAAVDGAPVAALPDPRAGRELLAMASTFAGNLTVLGSVANILVADAGRDVGGIGFWQHLRIGAPIPIATTAAGAAWLAWLT
ncbi:MAG: hypothetical protein D6689_15795 [Deltaproteobacteria bacterium]|nr:MAG: hypothetical protein D6689_15795 [Deltaproteobacteria bacterium]